MKIKSGLRNAAALLLLAIAVSLCGSQKVKAAGGGSLDSTFNANAISTVNGVVRAVVVQPDGKLIIGGFFANINDAVGVNIARLNPDGTPDAAFNSNIRTNAAVLSVILLPEWRAILTATAAATWQSGTQTPATGRSLRATPAGFAFRRVAASETNSRQRIMTATAAQTSVSSAPQTPPTTSSGALPTPSGCRASETVRQRPSPTSYTAQ
jgi:Domain of unknown function (DUF5122) beta-propeller